MNKDNMLIKIISTFNEGIFSNVEYEMKVSDMVSKALSYGGYDVSNCRFRFKNLFGNLDMCFIYDEVDTDISYEMVNVDDSTGTRVIFVIFVTNLLNHLRRLKPTPSHPYCYKIYDGSNNFLGYAKDYDIKDGKVSIKPEDFDRKVPKNRAYQLPTNEKYISELSRIFRFIVDMIKPNAPIGTITERIYDQAPIVMALYSHKVTISDPIHGDYSGSERIVDMVNRYDLMELLDGKILER